MNIENLSEFVEVLKKIGWTFWKDEVGDPCISIRCQGNVLSSVIGYKDYRKNQFASHKVLVFAIGGSIAEDAGSAIYTLMFNPNKRISELCNLDVSPDYSIEKPLVTEFDVEEVSNAFIEWGRNFDVAAALRKLCDLPTNSSGDYPARHLAALAACGEVDQLTGYLDSFTAGDRLGFVPYIKKENIEIALDFARQRRIDPTWLPKRPKMRV